MHVNCSCPSCRAQFKVSSEYAGRQIRCPKCANAFTVPSSTPADSTVNVVPSDDVPVATPVPMTNSAAATQMDFPTTSPTSATERMHQLQNQRRRTMKLRVLLALFGCLLAAAVYGGYSIHSKRQLRPGTLVLDGDAMNLSGVLVVVDGERLGTLSGKQTRFDVEPGNHVLVLKRRGFGPIEKQFHVGRGDQWHINPVWIRPDGLPSAPLDPRAIPTPANRDTE